MKLQSHYSLVWHVVCIGKQGIEVYLAEEKGKNLQLDID